MQAEAGTVVVDRGTRRVRSFAATWSRISPALPALGITRVANVTGLDELGIPVVMVCRPNAATIAVAQGKGLTLDAARLSGAMEAIEHAHGERVVADLDGVAPATIARGGEGIDLSALPLAHPGASPLQAPPMGWVRGRELRTGAPRWVPHEWVAMGTAPAHRRTFARTSAGLASGNSDEEAISHAICELVERHALAIWSQLPGILKTATRFDPATIEDPDGRRLLERCGAAGVTVGVFDMTCEFSLPAIACWMVSSRPGDGGDVAPAAGFGCHPSREVALCRAITEAAQDRLTRISGARDDLTAPGSRPGSFAAGARAFLQRDGWARFDQLASAEHPRVSDDVAHELDALERGGAGDVVVCDLQRPGLGIPVVRVTIPGLRIPRFASQRDHAASRRDPAAPPGGGCGR